MIPYEGVECRYNEEEAGFSDNHNEEGLKENKWDKWIGEYK